MSTLNQINNFHLSQVSQSIFKNIPKAIEEKVFSFFSWREVLVANRVSKTWRNCIGKERMHYASNGNATYIVVTNIKTKNVTAFDGLVLTRQMKLKLNFMDFFFFTHLPDEPSYSVADCFRVLRNTYNGLIEDETRRKERSSKKFIEVY